MVWVLTTMRRRGRAIIVFIVGGLRLGGGGKNGGHQVGETFAHAGAGFDDQMLALFDGRRHGAGHFQLLGAFFVLLQSSGDASLRPQDFDRIDHESLTTESRRHGAEF